MFWETSHNYQESIVWVLFLRSTLKQHLNTVTSLMINLTPVRLIYSRQQFWFNITALKTGKMNRKRRLAARVLFTKIVTSNDTDDSKVETTYKEPTHPQPTLSLIALSLHTAVDRGLQRSASVNMIAAAYSVAKWRVQMSTPTTASPSLITHIKPHM